MQPWIQLAAAQVQEKAVQTSSGGSSDPTAGFMSILPLILIFVLFYILFIVPQRKQQKKHEELLKTLRKGDEVVTSGGMFGTIVGFNEKENSIYLKFSENIKVEIQRSAISGLRKKTEAVTQSSPNK